MFFHKKWSRHMTRATVIKRCLLTIGYWLLAVRAYSQTQPLLPVSAPAALSPWMTRWLHETRHRLSLPDLPTASSAKHVRLFTLSQVLDFWQTSAGDYQGQLRYWVEEAGTKDSTRRTYSKTYPLATATVQALFYLVDSTQILLVPTQESIGRWQPFSDGVFYTIEQTGPLGYQVQSWSNPDAQKGLPEAYTVTVFLTKAFALLQAPQQWQAFEATIPYRCYSSNGGSFVSCHLYPTLRQKPQRKSRKPGKNGMVK